MSSNLTSPDVLARVWEENPNLIKTFLEVRPKYEQLCNEVAYILKKRLDEGEIEYSAITSRAKALNSFIEKLSRKQYDDPLQDVTDFSGVRVVYLYKSDREVIEKLIEAEFDIIEKVDKVEGQEADRFGYGALHYLVRLGRKSSGARYDDLKNLISEIQVRTVLQDAWAIIDHHLSYKQESDVPKILKRKLNSLSGLFETADDQFDRIRIEREQYKEVVKNKLISKESFLDQEVNFDTFSEFLKWKFPEKQLANGDGHLSRILGIAIKYGYTKLSDLDAVLDRTTAARAAMFTEKPVPYAVAEIARAIAFEQPEYRDSKGWSDKTRNLFSKRDHLVSKT